AMNYPYFHAWRDILTGRAAKLFRGYRPNAPTLFVYGQRKPGHFHTAQWLEQVRATPGGEVVELPIGHWVTLDPTFVDLVDRWLTKVLAPPPPA
ncbi:MAG TPA: hypothetical protein VLC09_13385, partial [Polyangiaceae bacterium]|nr:hypothetical protein [Polyangiaceae bacterium]